jgi:hypothetical protein
MGREARPARAATRPRPLWRCPRCGKLLVTRNLHHSCARYPLALHFRGKPRARKLFDRLRAAAGRFGPVRTVVNKTGIAFMVRVRFAGVRAVRQDSLRCALWLTRHAPSPRWVRIDRYAPRVYIHQFELRAPGDLDAALRGFLGEAYAVGCQRHLMGGAPSRAPARARRLRADRRGAAAPAPIARARPMGTMARGARPRDSCRYSRICARISPPGKSPGPVLMGATPSLVWTLT